MITLSEATIDLIETSAKTAKLLDIEEIFIDKESVRGMKKEDGFLIVTPRDNSALEFDEILINRVSVFLSRFNALETIDEIAATVKNRAAGNNFVTSLDIVGGRTSLEYKCGDYAQMRDKMPKRVADPTFYRFDIQQDTIKLITKALGAMGSTTITLMNSDKGDVFMKMSSEQGEVLNHLITDELAMTGECDKDRFSSTFKIKPIMALIKECAKGEFLSVNITRRGALNLEFNGLNIFVMPET
jgi:hypothetical protein